MPHRWEPCVYLIAMLASASCTPMDGQAADITAEVVVEGLVDPVGVVSPPADFDRLFVLEQHSGNIRIIRDGVITGTFLTVTPVAQGGEQGLLGMAFHPNYAANGRFYVSYNLPGGMSVLAEFLVSDDPDAAIPESQRVLLTQEQPYSNHNGGQIQFGPDGYLYFGLGDGGSGGDPQNRAQDDSTWLGKILRIDVDGRDEGKEYTVPPTNPFVGAGDPLDEIWAKGLRILRFSFDRLTGDLYIADVGQGSYEEIDYQPAASAGGENYGWRLQEGTHVRPSTGCDAGGGLVDPVFEYAHNGSVNNYGCPTGPTGCSVTGGYVYRGQMIPELQGRYVFADYCSDRVHSLLLSGGAVTECREHTASLRAGAAFNAITSFGEDAAGELYFVGDGKLFRIVRVSPPPVTGDLDNDGDVDISDLAKFIQNVSGPALPCAGDCGGADLDRDADVDQTDFGAFQKCLERPGPDAAGGVRLR